ncbi:hypothetical protein GW835_02495 [archaeon]|nr:hypothetical protein [archaeon]NCP79414.1 hypothetical protein [archaeon]NCP97357.1 hypothetical protein [archaeon]NCQ07181.1 hypothetical protein [archaeon]NCQ50977.1 hypothetical protein [archaeon]
MRYLKKIILTVILITFILLVQSYVFSASCNLTPNQTSLRTLSLGCSGDACDFVLIKSEDVSSQYNSCIDSCDPDNYPENYKTCMTDCYDSSINSTTDISLNSSLSFSKSSECSDKEINVSLAADINFEMLNETTSLSISGIDSLNTNGKDIIIFVNNNDKLGDATFRFDFSDLIISDTSKIIMTTKERTSITDSINGGWDDWKRDGIKLYFNNLEILENASLDLNMYIPKNIFNVIDEIDMPRTSLAGGELTFDGNLIVNNGNLNIYLKAQDSQDGRNYIDSGNCFDDPASQGGTVKEAGHIFFNLNYLENNGLLFSKMLSGNGGIGGNGSKAQDGCRGDPPGHGGRGGNAGDIFLYINNIDNTSNIDFNLIAGNAGPGGDTGFDGGNSRENFAIGGSGGNGGNIYFCKPIWNSGFSCLINNYNSLINKGNFNLVANTGFGNNGGNKNNHPDEGRAGDGGDGGSYLSSLTFDFIRNSGNLNIALETGYGGFKGTTDGGEDGVGGRTPNFFINFLENSSENLNIFLNSKHEIGNLESDVIIDKLQNGSYLPSMIYTVFTDWTFTPSEECAISCQSKFDSCYHLPSACNRFLDMCLYTCDKTTEDLETVTQNRKIKINDACYVKQPSSALDYMTGFIYVNSANKDVFENLLPENVSSNLTNNSECVICDYYDFENLNEIFPTGSGNKFFKNYTLYSTVQGKINAGDLEIHYAKNDLSFTKINKLYNPFTKENNLPLYSNKQDITSSQEPNSLGLYEYNIDASNLEWYYDKEMDLSEKDLYCYNQNYRIEGKIGTKIFNFPFTPLFKN